MGSRSSQQFGFQLRQPSTTLNYEFMELLGAVYLGEVHPDALQSAEVQQELRKFERQVNAVARSLSSEGGGGASSRSCCGRSGGGVCLPGSVMGHGGMSLSGRPLSRSFDDGGVVASLDEVREEEGAWAPPGWRWVCLDGGRSLVRAAVRECPRTMWFPGSEPCHCHSSEAIEGCMAEEDDHVSRYLSHWSELPRGWVVVLGPTRTSRLVPAAWEATAWSDE